MMPVDPGQLLQQRTNKSTSAFQWKLLFAWNYSMGKSKGKRLFAWRRCVIGKGMA